MYMKHMLYFLFIVVIIIIIIQTTKNNKLDECFYDPRLFPELRKINQYEDEIMDEFENFCKEKNNWIAWPEKNLYDNENNDWKIFPFFSFGKWSEKNCSIMPNIAKYLKSIPNLKVALLSKMGPRSKLKPHKGWGKYSNHIVRCHYGLRVPMNKCYMAVKTNEKYEKKYHENNKWLVFDDSKEHYAHNDSDEERIILIIDLKRPKFLKEGDSDVEYSEELVNLVSEFKKSL